MVDNEMKEWAQARLTAAASRRQQAESDEERRQCAHAALAVVYQLGQAEYGTPAMAALGDLLGAMQDLEEGRLPKLLVPSKRAGRPTRAHPDVAMGSAVGASVEILYRDGMPLADAAKHVAKRVKRVKLTPRQVKKIREKVMGAEYGDDALRAFREAVKGATEDQRDNGRPAQNSVDTLLRAYA